MNNQLTEFRKQQTNEYIQFLLNSEHFEKCSYFTELFIRSCNAFPLYLFGGIHTEIEMIFPQIADSISKSIMGILYDEELLLSSILNCIIFSVSNDSNRKLSYFLKDRGYKIISFDKDSYLLLRQIYKIHYKNQYCNNMLGDAAFHFNVQGKTVLFHLLKGQLNTAFYSNKIEQTCIDNNIPFASVETDYTKADKEQLKIRIEAFSELLQVHKKRKGERTMGIFVGPQDISVYKKNPPHNRGSFLSFWFVFSKGSCL